jgi:hypothetical protein
MNSTTRTELLKKLVTTFHLNVPERKGLDLPIRRSELEVIVSQILLDTGEFSCPLGHIGPLPEDRFELCRQVEVGMARYMEVRDEFRDITEAAQEMVRLIINDYPAGSLDGFAIEK